MATDETDETDEKDARSEPPASPESDGGDGSTEVEGASSDLDEKGWPRSWIVVASLLGVVAIIVVARLAGRQWEEVPEEPPPPAPPASAPTAGPEPGTVDVELKDVELPSKFSCLGTDGKAHPCPQNPAAGKAMPEPCRLAVKGNGLRLDIQREDPGRELLLWVYGASDEPPLLLHTQILPRPTDDPIWFASNQGASKVIVVLQNPHEKPTRLARVRLMNIQ